MKLTKVNPKTIFFWNLMVGNIRFKGTQFSEILNRAEVRIAMQEFCKLNHHGFRAM